MPNTILTLDVITKEALKVLHEKLIFTNKINKSYESSFGRKGAQAGDTIRVRKPAQFKTRKGKTLDVQDFIETSVNLTIDKQVGLDVEFSDLDLALELNSFSDQFLRPAMAQLASDIEADTLSMILKTSNSIYNGTGLTYRDTLSARRQLNQSLAPAGNWCLILDPYASVNMVDELKGLFQDATSISKQYKEGLLGRTSGFDFYESNIMPLSVNPSDVAGTVTVLEGGDSADLAGLGATEVIPAGFRFKVAGSKKVHAETKKAFGDLYEFVVLEDAITDGAGAVTVSIYPVFGDVTDARQNISVLPAAASAIVVDGAADEEKRSSIAFAKDAFTMACIDLEIPKGEDMASRQVMDGISLRFVRGWDIEDGSFKSRFDAVYGYTNLREQLGCLMQEPNV